MKNELEKMTVGKMKIKSWKNKRLKLEKQNRKRGNEILKDEE